MARTQVGIVGAGPSGLILAHMLRQCGIESVVVEAKSRAYCESRVRAGVLEHDAAALLDDIGVGARMRREGLVHRGIHLRSTRSLITLGMLIALGRDEEFEMHVRASAAAGVSRAEVKELILQSAIYCGVPAANHAFKLAERTFAALDASSS